MNTYRTVTLLTKAPLLFTRQFWFALLLLAVLAAPSATRAGLRLTQLLAPVDRLAAVGSTRILVKPKSGAVLSVPNIIPGATVLRTFPAIGNLQIVQLPAGLLSQTAITLLLQTGLVEYAEPDSTVRILATDPNDFRYTDGSLWGLHNTGANGGTVGADIDARDAWDTRTSAANVIVAIVDTGIRTTHEDLAPNLWVNSSPTVGDINGLNAIQNNGNINDDHGHGSHVAGTIGGVGNNTVGVVGVAWKVQLMALKFLDSQGNGAISDAVTCIDYARAHGANVINASWGSPSFASNALHDAIASARDAGIVFVAACGNSAADNDQTPLYPASYNQSLDNVIAVAATDRTDQLASFSDFGAHSVQLGAPGSPIFSCWNGSDSDYRYDDGTSMACAITSGAVALVRAQFPSFTYRQIIDQILSNTDPRPSLAGKTTTGGRLNLFKAIAGVTPPPTVPLPPSNLSATATSSTAINLAWTDNANNEQGFAIERSTDSGVTFTQIATTGANATSFANTGLTANTTYFYRVRAFNSAGNSAYSNSASATTQAGTPPPQPPAAPSNLAATATSSSAINLTWTDNANNEDGFSVERSTDNGTTFTQVTTTGANATSFSDTGLTANTVYFYRVRAFNAAGNSAYSNSASATTQAGTPPPQPPAAPSNLAATATSSSAISLTWSDNANNEDGFLVERSIDNSAFTQIASIGANATSYSDTGLAASTTYFYRVRASNSAGNSAYSNTASATTQAAQVVKPTLTASAPVSLASKIGPIAGQFAITRSGAPLDQSVTVHLTMGGSAVNGVDYRTIPNTVTLAAGQSSVTIALTPIPNGLSLGLTKTATLQLQADDAYTLGSPASATITIVDVSVSLLSTDDRLDAAPLR